MIWALGRFFSEARLLCIIPADSGLGKAGGFADRVFPEPNVGLGGWLGRNGRGREPPVLRSSTADPSSIALRRVEGGPSPQ